MRVMIVVTDTRRGGAPNRCAAIARGASELGWRVKVVSLFPSGPVLNELADEGIATAEIGLRFSWQFPQAVRRLRSLVRDWHPDVVHTSLWHANLVGRLAVGGGPVPVIGTFETMYGRHRSVRLLVDRITLRRAIGHVAVSHAVAEIVRRREKVKDKDLHIIPFGLDGDGRGSDTGRGQIRRSFGIPLDAQVVAWVGRFHPVKNLPMVMNAVGSQAGWWLLVAGAGPVPPQLGDWVAEAGLEGRFKFAGEMADVGPVLRAADVFVLASKWEAMPLALLEAMAAGLPVVAPRVGGIPEIVTNGHDGLLIPPDDVKALSDAIEDAAKRPELGWNARQTVKSCFGRDEMLAAYDRLWRNACGATPEMRS